MKKANTNYPYLLKVTKFLKKYNCTFEDTISFVTKKDASDWVKAVTAKDTLPYSILKHSIVPNPNYSH